MNTSAPALRTPVYGAAAMHPLSVATTGMVSTLPSSDTDGITDALTELYALAATLSDDELTTDASNCKNGQNEHDAALARRTAELARAKREASRGGFFKKLKSDIGIVGVAGLCTFNYALVAGDIAAHQTGLVKNLKLDVGDGLAVAALPIAPEVLLGDILVRKLNIAPDELQQAINDRLGPLLEAGVSDKDVAPLVDKAVAINLLVAGSAASVLTAGTTTALVVALVAVAMSAGAFASQEAGGPAWLSIGLGIGSGVLTLGAGLEGGAASLIDNSAATKAAAEAVAGGINGTSATIGGVDTVVNASHQHIEDDANTKAQSALLAMQKVERIIDDLLDAMKEIESSKKQTTSSIQSALSAHDQTNLTISTAIKA